MTGQRFDRDLSVLLQELGERPMPEYRHRIVERVERTRQRPSWTFPSRWLPKEIVMDVPMTAMRPIAGSTRRLGLVIAVAALLLAVLALALGAGRRTTPPYGIARNGQLVYAAGGDILVRDTVFRRGSAPDRRSRDRHVDTFDRQGERFAFFRATTAPASSTCGSVLPMGAMSSAWPGRTTTSCGGTGHRTGAPWRSRPVERREPRCDHPDRRQPGAAPGRGGPGSDLAAGSSRAAPGPYPSRRRVAPRADGSRGERHADPAARAAFHAGRRPGPPRVVADRRSPGLRLPAG